MLRHQSITAQNNLIIHSQTSSIDEYRYASRIVIPKAFTVLTHNNHASESRNIKIICSEINLSM